MILDIFGLAIVVAIGVGAIIYGIYELWTMPPDDERWEIIAEAQRNEWGRHKWE